MAHEIFEEPLTLVLWLIITVVLLSATLLSGMSTSKLLTSVYLKVYNHKVSTLFDIASEMPEGSEMYLPVQPDYKIGTTEVTIHQSLSERYVEIMSTVYVMGKPVMRLDTITPFTGLLATHRDPLFNDKYLSINYLYQLDDGSFGYVSPFSGAVISQDEVLNSQYKLLTYNGISKEQVVYKDNLITVYNIHWVYDASSKNYIHIKKQNGLLVIESDSQ